MNQPDGKNAHGLARQLLIWFLTLSILPLLIVSMMGYYKTNTEFSKQTEQLLLEASTLHMASLRSEFERMQVDAHEESNRNSNRQFLQNLITGFEGSGMSARAFVNTDTWKNITDVYGQDLRTFWNAYDYHDVYLVDLEGNVLFTFHQYNDLGQNLINGSLSQSRFADAIRLSLSKKDLVFSDLEYYHPLGNELSGVILCPVFDEEKQMIGLLGLQIAGQKISNLVLEKEIHRKATGFNTIHRYMIGQDLTLRNPNGLNGMYPPLKRPVDTEISRKWADYVNSRGKTTAQSKVYIYNGPLGEKVMGCFDNVEIAGVSWGYIVEVDRSEALETVGELRNTSMAVGAATLILVFAGALFVTRRITQPLKTLSAALNNVSQGNFEEEVAVETKNELGALAQGFNLMIGNLRQSSSMAKNELWLKDGSSHLNYKMQGDHKLVDLCRITLHYLCNYLNVDIGAFYSMSDTQRIQLTATYAFRARKGFRNEFGIGEGLVGQAALEQETLVFSDVPDDYMAIGSGLGETVPRYITVVPLVWNKEVVALLEFGTVQPMTDLQRQLIELVASRIAVAVQTTMARDLTRDLLHKTQEQAEELRVREEELKENNELLKRQTQELQVNEETLRNNQEELQDKNEKLQAQQEELRVANEELEEKARELQESRDVVESKNQDLEQAREELMRKANDLANTSKYKSEFLANMSHELRTPLNSLLILSKILCSNEPGNLSEKQVEYARTINESGSDLLSLINDILDLSKIEAGKMDVHIETVYLKALCDELRRKFSPMADKKGLSFQIQTDKAPASWRSDTQKLNQILRNLLSNAFKFTELGEVTLTIGPVPSHIHLNDRSVRDCLALAISDTGIGIPQDKQQTIFEAFQQADGTTSRKYGGTGLGLSISRELARLLGGEIQLHSEEGKGSTFTLIIAEDLSTQPETNPSPEQISLTPTPKKAQPTKSPATEVSSASDPTDAKEETAEKAAPAPSPPKTQGHVPDDRLHVSHSDRTILVIEDDPRFASILADMARDRGFKVLVAENGEIGLHFADYFKPNGIILDISLPGIDGNQVLNRLKNNSRTRHIPVQIMSARDNNLEALRDGAVGYYTKPVPLESMEKAFMGIEDINDRTVKKLLLVEDDPAGRQSVIGLIGEGDVETVVAASGEEARDHLEAQSFDCIVLDLGLPNMTGHELLEYIKGNPKTKDIPVVVYTGKELDEKERVALEQYSRSIIIKDAHSPERLLDSTSLFLHRVEASLPEESRRMIRLLHDKEALLKSRKVLIVDDDMRNVFALNAALQEKGMEIVVATHGQEALDKLDEYPDMSIVLMDIMMPGMDGYEACRRIRAQSRFAELPIIALTAKAMKGDRAKCIDAGASDYLPKPVDTEKLLSMMRVWLYR